MGSIAVGVLVSTGALPSLSSTQTAPVALPSVTLAKLEYWHKDHLGCLAATTDHAGALTARYAHDPFGKRRFTQGTYDAAGTLEVDWSLAVNNGTDRGFTGHEHLDDLGLIHMNGRVYDPALGRFLSADTHVTNAFDLQNYDRYAYVLNNPLVNTDPTGWEPNREAWLNTHAFDLAQVSITGSAGTGGCGGGNTACIQHVLQTLGNRPVTTAMFMAFTAQAMPGHPAAKVAAIAAIAAVACNATQRCKAAAGRLAGQLSESFDTLLSENGKAEAEASDKLKTNGANSNVPPVPGGLVGDQDDTRAGPRKGGNSHTSGPLTPENGGTGDFGKDLEKLTGGTRPAQPGDSAPPGSLIGANGIFGRPKNSSGGASIDIPANGNKPHETLHYP